jgi:hypothetical protein
MNMWCANSDATDERKSGPRANTGGRDEPGSRDMKRPLTLLAVSLAGLGANACGSAGDSSPGTGKTAAASGPRSASPAAGRHPDVDYPEPSYDGDDGPARHFGRAADTADRRAVTLLLRRYYAAAIARDGRRACSLMASRLAKSVVEDHSRSRLDPALHGKPCAAIMSVLFTRQRGRVAVEAGTLRVAGVRVAGEEGYALLRMKTAPVGWAFVLREHGAWKLGTFAGTFT